MATGVYLTKGVSDIFDIMLKMDIKKVSKIVSDLNTIYANAPNYLEIVTLGKEKVNIPNLKQILGNKYTEKEYEDFVKIFKNLSDKGNKNVDMGKNKNQHQKQFIKMKFSDDFWMMMDKIDDKVAWALMEMEQDPNFKNTLGIEFVDVSDNDYYFDVTINGRESEIKIGEFIRSYLGNKFNKGEVYEFIFKYNKIKNRVLRPPQNVIQVPDFSYDAKNVRSTFISLVTETYPHGHEEEVLKFLPDLDRDKCGNFYKIIGNSHVMFTSHLDTASRDKSDVVLVSKEKEGQELIMTDGTTILGADDKAGVTVMLYMMEHNVPGIYYFFIGEERGGIGSSNVAEDFSSFPYLKDVKKVISFDRRNYYSIITQQMGMECCSKTFGESLCKEFSKNGIKMGLDPTGVFTDSYNFVDIIPECTNVSVGYFNEHTHEEVQNISFLEKLAKACVKINWDELPIGRKIGIDDTLLSKWGEMINDIKEMIYYNDISVKGYDGRILITIEFDDNSLRNAYNDLAYLETTFSMYKCDPDIRFDGDQIKIYIS